MERLLAEGSYVHKGDTLVVIDSPEIRSKIAEANAAKAAADEVTANEAGGEEA